VQPLPASMDVGKIALPKYMKYSSKPEYNDLQQVRERLRMQRTFHFKYDPFVDSKLGKMYYQGVDDSSPDNLEGTAEFELAPKNLYAYNLQKGTHKKVRAFKESKVKSSKRDKVVKQMNEVELRQLALTKELRE
jgi:hypothetical protein